MKNKLMIKTMLLLAALLVGNTLFSPKNAQADSRHFGYLYQADSILEKGKFEFEQWLTYKVGKNSGKFHQFDFREEIEYGITDRLTTAVYLNFRSRYRDGVAGSTDEEKMYFKGISSEWKYMLVSPNLKPIGVMLYFETTYNGKELELEEKLILQHNFGEKWILALNTILEQEWEFENSGTVKKFVLENNLGLALKIHKNWSLGIEGRAISTFDNFDNYAQTAFYAGPTLHFEKGRFWGTFAIQPQLTTDQGGRNYSDHEKLESRIIAGIHF